MKIGSKTDNTNNSQQKLILTVLSVILIVIVLLFATVKIVGRPYDRTDNTYTKVTIIASDNTSTVGEKLKTSGVIGNVSGFKFLSKVLMYDGKYKPGTYFLSPSMTVSEISNMLTQGITTNNGFEIPSGMTIKQLAKALEQAGYVNADTFLKVAAETDFTGFTFIDGNIKGYNKLEGFMFPSTYSIDEDATEIMIITTILNEFSNFFNDDYRARAEEMNMSIRDIVIIASMIEKETNIEKEMPDIAATIYNRRNSGLDFDIPNKPLCSPGEAAIKAALYPSESDNLYYVLSDKLDGSHIFTSDKQEFTELEEKYKKAKSEQK